MRMFYTPMVAAMLALSVPAAAQEANPLIDYNGFTELSLALADTRTKHLIGLEDFLAKAAQSDAIVLDTRSAEAFQQGHIKGAVNLPFSDFTQAKLADVLGEDGSRPILIYCNNNFSDNRQPVGLKKAPLALNIPTFINLHGYGYTNVWELADLVSIADVAWTGEPVAQAAAVPAS